LAFEANPFFIIKNVFIFHVLNSKTVNQLRALRRHHKIRLNKKRINYYTRGFYEKNRVDVEHQTLKFVDTPKPCSCWMCGNPRKHWKEETRQELISKTIFYEQARSFQ